MHAICKQLYGYNKTRENTHATIIKLSLATFLTTCTKVAYDILIMVACVVYYSIAISDATIILIRDIKSDDTIQ